MNYTHLTREERYQIYALKKAGHKQSEIAIVLKRSASTISRELSRNTGGRGYRPKQALHHHHATGDKPRDETIEQQTEKTAWIPDARSGILRVRRCTSKLNPRKFEHVLLLSYRDYV